MTLDSDKMVLTAAQSVDYYNASGIGLDVIKFNLYPNAFREGAKIKPYYDFDISYPDGIDYGWINIAGVKTGGKALSYSVGGADMNVLTVELEKTLKNRRRQSIDIEYSVKIPKTHMRLGYYGQTVNLTNFFPSVCVYENGAFIECPYLPTGDPFYSEAADFKVTLSTDRAYTAAHSGDKVSEEASGESRSFKFSGKRIRDFALCLSESFGVKSIKSGKITVNYYYQKGDLNVAEKSALTLDVLTFFGEYFSRYPYKTYSVAETFLTAGGMEYPNLVFVNKDLKESDKDTVIVHETAHQWWYGIVGSDNLKSAWMDEGLAEFSTELYFAKNSRLLKALEYYQGNYAASKRFDDIIKEINPANITMDKGLNEFSSEYEYVAAVYSRGHLLFKDVYKTIGEGSFKQALRSYINKNQYGIAHKENMTDAFNEYYSGDIRIIFGEWISFTKNY
jgi:hypothetical protein